MPKKSKRKEGDPKPDPEWVKKGAERAQPLIDAWDAKVDKLKLDKATFKDFRAKLIPLFRDLVTDFACATALSLNHDDEIKSGVELVTEEARKHFEHIYKNFEIGQSNFDAIREELSDLYNQNPTRQKREINPGEGGRHMGLQLKPETEDDMVDVVDNLEFYTDLIITSADNNPHADIVHMGILMMREVKLIKDWVYSIDFGRAPEIPKRATAEA